MIRKSKPKQKNIELLKKFIEKKVKNYGNTYRTKNKGHL
jgi:hypothetical protein